MACCMSWTDRRIRVQLVVVVRGIQAPRPLISARTEDQRTACRVPVQDERVRRRPIAVGIPVVEEQSAVGDRHGGRRQVDLSRWTGRVQNVGVPLIPENPGREGSDLARLQARYRCIRPDRQLGIGSRHRHRIAAIAVDL